MIEHVPPGREHREGENSRFLSSGQNEKLVH